MASNWNGRISRAVALAWLMLSPLSALADSATAAVDDAPPPLLGGYMRESRIVYPLTVQDWHAQGEHRYEQAEAGVSVRYVRDIAEEAWLDVYVYPVGEIGTGALDAHMAQTIGELEGIAGQAHGRKIEFGTMQADRIPLDEVDDSSADGAIRSVGGRMDNGDARYHTALAIALRQYYVIKGRYSVREEAMSPDAARTALAGFIEQFVQAVRIFSTGGCGALPPIVVIDAGSELPATRLADVTRDDQVRGVLTGDYRVLTHTPDDPAALLLQASGKALREARFPGCAGESPVEPEVPEGHREIRIEYRAPSPSRTLSLTAETPMARRPVALA